ncbi:MAG: site-2 protease family protein [Clostridia bacterium]|nr:site-2 protease family protein [Clostridia bacterium]
MRKFQRLRVAPQVAILIVVMALSDQSGICAVTLLAAAFHECGHLLAARCLRIPLGCLRLSLLGARLEIRGRMLTYGEEWVLSAAGPLTSLLISLAAAPLWRYGIWAQYFSCASLVLGLLNLLPIQSFDGGRMLETALAFFGGETVARRGMLLFSFTFLFLLWAFAAYFLLRAGDGLSLFCFSLSLFLRFFDHHREQK